MDHNVQTWQVRPTLPRTHEEVVIPETRSPKAPPEPPHPICPSLVCSAPPSVAWGGRGPGWVEGFLSTPGSWSEPASSPGLLSGAGGRPPTACAGARARTHTHTWQGPAPHRAHSPPRDRFCLTCGEEARTGRCISPSSTHLKPSGVHPAPHTPFPVPHPPRQVSWLPLSWGELLGTHPPHQMGAPEAWAWPV